jgi:hypothetical protein
VRNRTPARPSIGDGDAMAFTLGDANMQNHSKPKTTDVAVLSLFFLIAGFVTLSGVLGPLPLWFR